MHIKKIYRNEGAPQAKGIAPMNAASFASKNPEGWVETKDGLILVFKGAWPPEQYPSKEAAIEAGNALNEALVKEDTGTTWDDFLKGRIDTILTAFKKNPQKFDGKYTLANIFDILHLDKEPLLKAELDAIVSALSTAGYEIL